MVDQQPITEAELAEMARRSRDALNGNLAQQANATLVLRLIDEVRRLGARPEGWGATDLPRFLDDARHNVLATAAKQRQLWASLVQTDDRLEQAGRKIGTGSAISKVDTMLVPALLLLRGHSAFRAAVHVGCSAQLPETYMLLRGTLECGLYASFMFGDAERQMRWFGRESGEAELRLVKREFRPAAMLTHLAARDPALGAEANRLYDLTIGLGAHPNELGFTSVTVHSQDERHHTFAAQFFSPGGEAHSLCLTSIVQTGGCLLRIMGLLFPE